jgi:hypothetical protein
VQVPQLEEQGSLDLQHFSAHNAVDTPNLGSVGGKASPFAKEIPTQDLSDMVSNNEGVRGEIDNLDQEIADLQRTIQEELCRRGKPQ